MTESVDRCECGGLFVGGQCCDCGSIHPEDRLRGVEPPMTAVVTGDGVVPLFTGAQGGKVSIADGAIERGLAIMALNGGATVRTDQAGKVTVHEPDPLVKAGLIAPPTIDQPAASTEPSDSINVETPAKAQAIQVRAWSPAEIADVQTLALMSGSPRRRQGAIGRLVTQVRHLQLAMAKTLEERDNARGLVVAIAEKLGGKDALAELMGEPAPKEPAPPSDEERALAEGDHGVL